MKGNYVASIKEEVFYRLPTIKFCDPLGIRSVGKATFLKGATTIERKIDFAQLVWGVSGRGLLNIQRQPHVLAAGDCALFLPGDNHCLRAVNETWHYRWITLDGACATVLLSEMGFPRKVFSGGPCPEEQFEKLSDFLKQPMPDALQEASALTYKLLLGLAGNAYLAETSPKSGKWVEEIIKLLSDRISDATCSIITVAEQLGMNRCSMTKTFKQHTGVSPKDYLSSLRLRRASELLRNTELSVQEIARMCGFTEANYFSKFFRKHTGKAPLQFRSRRMP